MGRKLFVEDDDEIGRIGRLAADFNLISGNLGASTTP